MHESERMSEMKREIKSKTVLDHWCTVVGVGAEEGMGVRDQEQRR